MASIAQPKTRHHPLALATALTLTSAGFLSAPVQAQGALEEIVVTAQKRSESLQDVPIAISAFTADTMDDMGINTTQDLQLATPGLVVASQSVLGQVYLRGVGSRFTFNGLDPSVATYVGDRYVPRGSGGILVLTPDVDRVEVLKGPQGILYGRNATGGAIRVIKKGVVDEFEGSAKVTAGRYGLFELGGTVNIPVTDNFGMRLSAQSTQSDGWQENIAADVEPGSIEDMEEQDRLNVNGQFQLDVSEQFSANLAIDYYKLNDDTVGYGSMTLGPNEYQRGSLFGAIFNGLDREHTATDATQANDGDSLGSELKLEYSFGGADLVSVTTYADYDLTWTGESDGTNANLFTPGFAADKAETWSQELRLVSTGDGPLQWTVGAYYYKDDANIEFWFLSQDAPRSATAARASRP